MRNYTLNEDTFNSIATKLRAAGYTDYDTSGYTRFAKGRGDSVFISHSLNSIRATKNTVGHQMIIDSFGSPNGKGLKGEVDRNSIWFFNDYLGKRGTKIDGIKIKNVVIDRFEFSIGRFGGECYSIALSNHKLIYARPASLGGSVSFDGVEITPKLSDWNRFLKKVEELQVWKWKKRYDNYDVLDGTQWELRLKVNDRTKNVYGSNEYPNKFDEFLTAVSKLVGGLPVR